MNAQAGNDNKILNRKEIVRAEFFRQKNRSNVQGRANGTTFEVPASSTKSKAEKINTAELTEEDIVIAVVGPTGAGKSTFINVATGVDSGIGHDLESCTSEILVVKMSFPEFSDYNIVFVDTPGFDDTKRSDTEILRMIADWLAKTFRRKILLSGLLYFHRISDNRMAGTPLKNLRMFEELCGKDALKNVILTTTMWDEVDEETGLAREEQLKSIYWKAMIDRHSHTGRFEGTRDSAFRLIGPLIDKANARHELLIQRELCDLDVRLKDTAAGRKFHPEMKELVKQQQTLLQRIREELKRPGNLEALQALKQKSEELREFSIVLFEEMDKLKVPLGRRVKRWFTVKFGLKRTTYLLKV